MKRMSSNLLLAPLLAATLAQSTGALAAIGFGSRNDSPATPNAAESVAVAPKPAAVAPAPIADIPVEAAKDGAKDGPSAPTSTSALPPLEGAEWLRVSFDQAENELMDLFQRDLPKVEEIAESLAIYEVRATGRLPQDYRRTVRNKLERVLIGSKKLSVKQCPACEESRVYRDEKGEVKYESFNSDTARPSKLASQIGVGHLIYTEVAYTPEDLQLRVRVVDATNGQLRFAKEYSTADVVKTRESFYETEAGEIGHGDALGRVLIGEVAFTTVLSPGLSLLPTIDAGGGSGMSPSPTVDLFLGEKFDRGRKVFGFLVGGTFTMGDTGGETSGAPLSWSLRIAPRFRYVFNPYTVTNPRWSVAAEAGAFISTGLATAYVGLGPEMAMVKRFSVSVTPIYIIPSTVKASENFVEGSNGSFSNSGSTGGGKLGGPGVLMKASINW